MPVKDKTIYFENWERVGYSFHTETTTNRENYVMLRERNGWILPRALELIFNSHARLTIVNTYYADPASDFIVNLHWFDDKYVTEPIPVQVTIPIYNWMKHTVETIAPHQTTLAMIKLDVLDALAEMDVPKWIELDSLDKNRPGSLFIRALHETSLVHLDLEYKIEDGWLSRTRFRIKLEDWLKLSKAPDGYCPMLGYVTDFDDIVLTLDRRGTYTAQIFFKPFTPDNRLMIVFPFEDPYAKHERGTPLMLSLPDYQATRWLLERSLPTKKVT